MKEKIGAQFTEQSNDFYRSLQSLCTLVKAYCLKSANSFSTVQNTERYCCQDTAFLEADTHHECQQSVLSRKQRLHIQVSE